VHDGGVTGRLVGQLLRLRRTSFLAPDLPLDGSGREEPGGGIAARLFGHGSLRLGGQQAENGPDVAGPEVDSVRGAGHFERDTPRSLA